MENRKMSAAAGARQGITSPSPITLERKSLHDQVVDRLRDMIVFGELAPGERIVEVELAKRLGVSRTPLREAIKTLTLDGLVENPVNRGARVIPLDPAEIESLFAVIAALEALAAESACSRMKRGDLAELELMHGRMRSFHQRGDRNEYFEMNSQIHERIIQFAGNDVLANMHERLMLRARRGRFVAIVSDERRNEALEEHEQLMQAFRARDAEGAFRIWRTHLHNTGKAVMQSLEETVESSQAR